MDSRQAISRRLVIQSMVGFGAATLLAACTPAAHRRPRRRPPQPRQRLPPSPPRPPTTAPAPTTARRCRPGHRDGGPQARGSAHHRARGRGARVDLSAHQAGATQQDVDLGRRRRRSAATVQRRDDAEPVPARHLAQRLPGGDGTVVLLQRLPHRRGVRSSGYPVQQRRDALAAAPTTSSARTSSGNGQPSQGRGME